MMKTSKRLLAFVLVLVMAFGNFTTVVSAAEAEEAVVEQPAPQQDAVQTEAPAGEAEAAPAGEAQPAQSAEESQPAAADQAQPEAAPIPEAEEQPAENENSDEYSSAPSAVTVTFKFTVDGVALPEAQDVKVELAPGALLTEPKEAEQYEWLGYELKYYKDEYKLQPIDFEKDFITVSADMTVWVDVVKPAPVPVAPAEPEAAPEVEEAPAETEVPAPAFPGMEGPGIEEPGIVEPMAPAQVLLVIDHVLNCEAGSFTQQQQVSVDASALDSGLDLAAYAIVREGLEVDGALPVLTAADVIHSNTGSFVQAVIAYKIADGYKATAARTPDGAQNSVYQGAFDDVTITPADMVRVEIDFVYEENGATALPSAIYYMEKGTELNHAIDESLLTAGFILKSDNENFPIADGKITGTVTESVTITVTVSLNKVNYTVKFVNADGEPMPGKDELTLQGVVGESTALEGSDTVSLYIEGYDYEYEDITLQADAAKNVIEVKYTAVELRVSYDSQGGSYIEPKVGKYGDKDIEIYKEIEGHDENVCGLQQHTHTPECYKLTCTKEPHTHGLECFDVFWLLIIPIPYLSCEKEVHTHSIDQGCYTNTCGLPEHVHGSECEVHIEHGYNPAPTRPGYVFAGWYLDEDCTQPAPQNLDELKQDVTVYAKWEGSGQAVYTIVYRTGVWNNSTGKEDLVYYTSYAAQAQIGSTVTADFTHANTPAYHQRGATTSAEVAPDGSTVVYADFNLIEYTLSFSADTDIDKSGSDSYSFTAHIGEDISGKWPTAADKRNEKFYGWKPSHDTDGTVYVSKRPLLTADMIGSGTTASYEASYQSGLENVQLNYWLETEEGGVWSSDNEYTQRSVSAGGDYSAKDIYGFTKRNTKPSGSQYPNSGKRGSIYNFYYDRNEYTIEYHNGTELFDTIENVPFDKDISDAVYSGKRPTTPPEGKEGYEFAGWYDNVQCLGDAYTFSKMPAGNLALYAKWVAPKHTVTFHTGYPGDDTKTETQEVTHGQKPTPPSLSNSEDWFFAGWAYDKDGTDKFDPAKPIEEATDLYAIWKPVHTWKYTVQHVYEDTGVTVTVNGVTSSKTTEVTVRARTQNPDGVIGTYLPDAYTKIVDKSTRTVTFTYTKVELESLTYDVVFQYKGETLDALTKADQKVPDDVTAGSTLEVVYNATEADAKTLLEDYGLELNQTFVRKALTSGKNVLVFTCTPANFEIRYENVDDAIWPEGKSENSNPGSYTIESGNITLVNPESKDGQDFIGWAMSTSTTNEAGGHDPMNVVIEPGMEKTKGHLTFTAQYAPNATITYVAYPEAGGTVSNPSETLRPVLGEAGGSTATAKPGYDFDGWYNEAGVKVSDKEVFVPQKTGKLLGVEYWEDATYTAKFVEDPNDLKECTYYVQYWKDGVKDGEPVEKKASVWAGETDPQLPVAKDKIAPANKYEGYKLDDTRPIPHTVKPDGTVDVYYVRDEADVRVEYVLEGAAEGVTTTDVTNYTEKATIGKDYTIPDEKLPGSVTGSDGKTYVLDTINSSKTVPVGEDGATITVTYALDEKGTDPENPDKPGDGIPDKYQKTVTYKVVNGKFTDGTTETSQEVLLGTKDENGEWSYTEAELNVPKDTVNMNADTGYKPGAWAPVPGEKVSKDGPFEYTYTYEKDESKTDTLSYSVKYFQDGVEVTEDSKTVTQHPWAGDHVTQPTIEEAINTDPDKYEGYTLDYTVPSSVPAEGTQVANGTVIEIHYAKDVKGTDPENPGKPGDGIPDKYQVTVTYKVVNGYWNGEGQDEADKSELVTLWEKSETGEWVEKTGVTLQHVPAVGAHPYTGYQAGAWDIEPVVPEKDTTYTYTYAPKTYTVTVEYVDQDGKVIKNPVVENVTFGTTYNVNGSITPYQGTITGNDEKSYRYDSEKTGDLTAASGTMGAANVTITLWYILQVTVQYEVTGDIPADYKDAPKSVTLDKGSSYTVDSEYYTEPVVVENVKYTFVGWYCNGFDASGEITITEDTTLTGKWIKEDAKHVLYVQGNPEGVEYVNGWPAAAADGVWPTGSAYFNGETFTIRKDTDVGNGTQVEGEDGGKTYVYTFHGWYTDRECTTPVVGIDDEQTMGSENKVYYGYWTRALKEYTVTLELVDEDTNAKLGEDTIIQTTNGGDYAVTDEQAPAKLQVGTDNYTRTTSPLPSGTVTEDTTVTVTYSKDNIGTDPDDPTKPGDTIPDKYQAEVIYESTENGSVDPAGSVVTTFPKNEDGSYATSGTVTAKSVATADKGYAFDYWDKGGVKIDAEAALSEELTLSGGTTITYTAHFDTDTLGGTDPDDPGDDIPDKYQVEVTYTVTNGRFGTEEEPVEQETVTDVVTLLDENGKRAEDGTGKLNPPAAGNLPNAGYRADKWDTADGNAPTEVTKNSEKKEFNYQYVEDLTLTTPYSFTIEFYKDGFIDNTKTKTVTEEFWDGTPKDDVKLTVKEEYLANPFTNEYMLEETVPETMPDEVKPGDTIQLYFVKDVIGDDPDDPNGTGDNIPDKYQVEVIYESAGNGSVEPEGSVVTTFTNEDGSYATSGTVAAHSVATAKEGYAFDKWTAPIEGTQLTNPWNAELNESFESEGGKSYMYIASFDEDTKGGEDGTQPDDIPDKYQATVTYKSADETQGTVDPAGTYTVTFGDREKGFETSGTYTASSTASAKENYAFDYWDKDGVTIDSDATLDETLENVQGGTTITYTAYFDEDTKGGEEDGNQPDGTPDKYQAIIYYKADANGSVEEKFTRSEKLDEGKTATLTASATAKANPGYAFDYWDKDGEKIDAEAALNETLTDVKGGTTITYTAHFATDTNGDNIPDYKQDVVITVVGNKDIAVFDGSNHTVSGYEITSVTIGEKDNGKALPVGVTLSIAPADATITESAVGTYPMGLTGMTATEGGFHSVTVKVTDGWLQIVPNTIDPGDPENPNPTDPPVPGEEPEPSPAPVYGGVTVGPLEDVVYNGTSQQQTPAVLDKDGNPLDPNYYDVTFSQDTTNVGQVTVTVTGKNGYEGSVDVTYNITPLTVTVNTDPATRAYNGAALTAGGEIVGLVNASDATLTTTGTQTNQGTSPNTYTVAFSSEAMKNNYTVEVGTIGDLTVTPRAVTLTSATATKVYDGTPLTDATVTVGGAGFVNGEGATYNVTGTLTDVGNVPNAFTYTLNPNTLARNYNITPVTGTLTITQAAATAMTVGTPTSVPYDGELHQWIPNVTGPTGAALAEGTDYTVTYSTADFTNVGEITVTITGMGNYAGTVTRTYRITPRIVLMTSGTATRAYNGAALTNPNVTATGFVEGEGATYNVTGSQTNVGTATNTYGYTLNDNTSADNYRITQFYGNLTVTPAALNVSNPNSFAYDGQAHQWTPNVTGVNGAAQLGTDYTMTYSTTDFTDVGTITVTVTGTGNYAGTVTRTYRITPRMVIMTSASATKAYDGTALRAENVRATGFAAGEGAQYNVTGSQLAEGSSRNTFTYTLNNNTDADNYRITQFYGNLTVTAAEPVEIPEDETPLGGEPDNTPEPTDEPVVIEDNDTPLGGLPVDPNGGDYTVNEEVVIDENETPLAGGPSEHICCILHFILMLCALTVAMYFTHDRKKRQEREFELRSELQDK